MPVEDSPKSRAAPIPKQKPMKHDWAECQCTENRNLIPSVEGGELGWTGKDAIASAANSVTLLSQWGGIDCPTGCLVADVCTAAHRNEQHY